MIRRWTVGALALLALTSLGALLLAGRAMQTPAAAAAGGDKPIPRVTITVREGAIDVPASVPTGFVAFTFQNATRQPLFGPVSRLSPGATLAELSAALMADDVVALMRLVTAVGGALGTPPGQSQAVILNLQAGTYVYANFAD